MRRQQRAAARRLARLAGRLHAAYERRHRNLGAAPLVATLSRFREITSQLDTERRRLALIAGRGWSGVENRLAGRVRLHLDQLPSITDSLRRDCLQATAECPAFADLYRELEASETEWGSVVPERDPSGLGVETEPIELKGIRLGPFRIILNLEQLATRDTIDAVDIDAVEPNPAAVNHAVTHPHVSDGRLCCGDAAHPIRAALESGRISDFFSIVRSVLRTYNPHSPYVSLDEWEGNPCRSCGDVVGEDDRWLGTHCDCVLCDECVRTSFFDDTVGCRECMARSDVSGEWMHNEDAVCCDECGRSAHDRELQGGLCDDCLERTDYDEDNEETTTAEPQHHGAGVHAVGLAQAPVPLPPR